MKVLFDTDSKTTAFIDDAGATVVHPTNETVTVPAGPSFTSELGQAFGHAPTKDDPNAWWNKPQSTQSEAREQYSPGQHGIDASTTRKVVELNGTGAFLLDIKIAKDGVHRLQLAGKPSGAISGAAAIIEPGKAERQIGSGNLDSFDFMSAPLKAGDTLTLSLDKTGGDDKAELVVTPQ